MPLLPIRSVAQSILFAACLSSTAIVAVPLSAQMGGMSPADGKKLPSPPALATTTLAGQAVSIKYNAPSVRGREIFGALVPYNQVWRTGANPATTLVTPVPLHIGSILVPAGTYTIYTLPSAGKWMLIVNKQTGQWGTEYNQAQDLGRTEMQSAKLPASQELMSISFESQEKTSAVLHIKWAKTDESVKVTTP